MLGVAPVASALTLQQVIDDGGFSTANGLQFMNFEVAITGDLRGMLSASDIEVAVGSDGFTLLSDDLAAEDGEVGDVLLQFDVWSTGPAIIGAALNSNVTASGLGALASVDELLTGDGFAASLAAFKTGGSATGMLSDSIGFAGQEHLHVVKDIIVDAFLIGDADGGVASATLIEQHFLVPEPATALLLLGGVAALAWARRRRLAAVLLAVGLLGATPADALTLQQVIDDGGFSTANGLQFMNFQVSITGDLRGAIDASDLDVVVGADGFQLQGPISAADGEVGDVLLQFDVWSTGQAIIAAALDTNVAANGLGALASVDELLTGEGGFSASLAAFKTGGSSSATFGEFIQFAGQEHLHVTKDIIVDAFLLGDADGGSARISLVEQRFLVPEPTTAALLLGGLACLAARRASARRR